MAKVLGPAYSRSASGTLGNIVFDKRGYARTKPEKKKNKPQTAAQGNVQQSFAASRKAVNIVNDDIKQAIKQHKWLKRNIRRKKGLFQPGFWAVYLASEMRGPKRMMFIQMLKRFENLDTPTQQLWHKAGLVAGLTTVHVPHASEKAIQPGFQLYWLATTLYRLSIYRELESPQTNNALIWAASITGQPIDVFTQAVNKLETYTDNSTMPAKAVNKALNPPTKPLTINTTNTINTNTPPSQPHNQKEQPVYPLLIAVPIELEYQPIVENNSNNTLTTSILQTNYNNNQLHPLSNNLHLPFLAPINRPPNTLKIASPPLESNQEHPNASKANTASKLKIEAVPYHSNTLKQLTIFLINLLLPLILSRPINKKTYRLQIINNNPQPKNRLPQNIQPYHLPPLEHTNTNPSPLLHLKTPSTLSLKNNKTNALANKNKFKIQKE